MPLLEKYAGRDAYYVLTRINDAVVTYQLTAGGERKLASAGVSAGQHFERALLLDLYRTGDAYAPGHEFPEAVRANQLSLDLVGDPSPESAFPTCDGCRSVIDLHLELTGSRGARSAHLHCPSCRATPTAIADTSIPLTLLSRSLVTRLFGDLEVATRSANVIRYVSLLDAEFVQRWDAVRKQRATVQSQLFEGEALGGLGLG